jgi:dTDP-4-dehydrorhamnose reductase
MLPVKALILGGSGQLGRALLHSAPADVEAVALARPDIDVTDSDAVERSVAHVRPTVLINATAYTAVDLAESEQDRAFAVNESAVSSMARACSERGVLFIHISTDFVFDGTSSRPYLPEDVPHPLNVYGASKLAGERQIQARQNLDWRIVRTAWVYASAGRNFVLSMLRLFRERDVVRVVADQLGTPTSAASLARCVWQVARDQGPSSILHFTDAGVASWYDFAVAIHEEATVLSLITKEVEIVPIGADQYPTRARRPAYGVLDKRATLARLRIVPVHWRASLREVLRELRA